MTNTSEQPTINQNHAEGQFAGDPDIIATAISMGVRSVERPEDIPESLRWVAGGTPGILFWHTPLGGGAPVPQIRPDTPDGPKYVMPKDSGSVISIAPDMQERLDADVDKKCRVLILEGTKQSIFGATFVDENTITVGIQGCWGFSHGGMALSSLDALCQGRDVVVGFDADISGNQSVYDAAQALETALLTIDATSVKFLTVPGSKKIGIDDYLTRRPLGSRSAPLMKMMDAAVVIKKIRKPPRQAAKKDSDGTIVFISTELGEVVRGQTEQRDKDTNELDRDQVGLAVAGENDGKIVRRVGTYLCAAPTIITKVQILDDLTQGVEPKLGYDVNLQIGPASDCVNIIIRDIPSDRLGKVRPWLDREGLAGGRVAFGPAGQFSNGPAKIEDAMRGLAANSDVDTRTTLARTGWYQHTDGKAYFVDAKGAHTDDCKTDSIRGQLEGPAMGIDIPGFLENYTLDEVRASVKAMLDVLLYLDDPTPWVCGISGMLWSIASGHPDAVLYIAGGAGSGKSSITEALASALGPNWGTGIAGMASVEGTTAYLSDVTRGIHNAPLILDDARDRSSVRGQENQDTSLDAVIRIGYSGGGAARGRKVVDASGQWKQSAPTMNRPFVIIVGETFPDSSPASTIERCLVVQVNAKTSLLPADRTPDGVSGHGHLVLISRTGALRPAFSHYIHRLMVNTNKRLRGERKKISNIDEIRQQLEEFRVTATEKALEKHWPKDTPVSVRVRNVTGTFIAGTSKMCEYISGLDMMTPEELKALENKWHQVIIRAAVDHAQVNLAQNTNTHSILERLQGSVKSGRYCFGEPTHPGQTSLGKTVRVHIGDEMVSCVALIPEVVRGIIGSTKHIDRQLSEILIRDHRNGLKRREDIGGNKIPCLVMKETDFWTSDNSDDEDSPMKEDF